MQDYEGCIRGLLYGVGSPSDHRRVCQTTCTNNYNNQWNLLDESARTTRETCTGSTTKHSEALAELEAEQQTNSHYTAQFNQVCYCVPYHTPC